MVSVEANQSSACMCVDMNIYKGLFFSHKEEWDYAIFRKIDGNRDYDVKENKPAYKDNITHFLSCVESIYKREKRR